MSAQAEIEILQKQIALLNAQAKEYSEQVVALMMGSKKEAPASQISADKPTEKVVKIDEKTETETETMLRKEVAELVLKLQAAEQKLAAKVAAPFNVCKVDIKRTGGRCDLWATFATKALAEAWKAKVLAADALIRKKSEEPAVADVVIVETRLFGENDAGPTWA